MACVLLRIRSSQHLFLLPPHCALLSSILDSTMCISLVAMRRSISLVMQDVKLMGRKEDNSDAGFPGFKRGIIVALRQTCGQTLSFHERLKSSRSSLLAAGPNALMNAGVISSGPAAPLVRIRLMPLFNSASVKSWELSSLTVAAFRRFLDCLLVFFSP